jgi:hypothetical protein
MQLLAVLLFAAAYSPLHAEEIGRLLAAVNGKVITDVDLNIARSLKSLALPGESVEFSSASDELERLIDLELMQQELENFSAMQADEAGIEARMQQYRKIHAEKFPALLKNLGFTESELAAYLRLEASIMRFINFRFRPLVIVQEDEKEKYYREKLTPQLQKAKIEIPPLEEVSHKIEMILIEEKVSSALERWMHDIRRNSRIEYFNEK